MYFKKKAKTSYNLNRGSIILVRFTLVNYL